MKVVVLVLLAIFGLAYGAEEKCKFDESTATAIRTGKRSKAEDDAEAYAYCQKGEDLIGCECLAFKTSPKDCDGAYFASYATGVRCVAKNGAFGKGVQAKATCQKTVITCTSSYSDMPVMSCPQNYKLINCALHSFFMHKLPGNPVIKRDGDKCATTDGCEDCQVQARCVRITK